jgi:FKBP-type peptidyl-prolyl cis-trans isomerase SlyD
VTISSIDGDRIVLDANHPLAGMTLHFDVKIVEVRAATAEELHHGHVHGPGGAHH